jgi:hypothetical protein
MSIKETEDLLNPANNTDEIVSMCETRKFVKKLEIQIDVLRKIIDPKKNPLSENVPENQDQENEN